MSSLITSHFPIVRFENGVRKWFNPVTRTRAADRPEERVRLRMIEFLVRDAGFSANRMSTEPPVPMQSAERAGRADILCFDSFHRPLLLVECKAESVPLTESTAIQAARYNQQIRAPYILLTNGIRDLLFAIQEDGSSRFVHNFASVFPVHTPSSAHDFLETGSNASEQDQWKSDFTLRKSRQTDPKNVRATSDGAPVNAPATIRPLAYWQDRGLWPDKPGEATGERDTSKAAALFLSRFWLSDDFGESTQYIPVQDPRLSGLSGAFVRTLKRGTTHIAAGIFTDVNNQLWLLGAQSEAGQPATTRLTPIAYNDISFLIKSVRLEDIIHWST